jgi:hypothetical protein
MNNSQQTGTTNGINSPNQLNNQQLSQQHKQQQQQQQTQLSAMISNMSNNLQHNSLPSATATSGQIILDLQKPPFHRHSAASQQQHQLQLQQHKQHQQQQLSPCLENSASSPSSNVNIKMETVEISDDNKPTDLSVAGDRKFISNTNSQFYP